jgi:hypothetical protein
MDGKPLRYRLRPDGSWVIYSVGTNGQDQGGDPTPVDTNAEPGFWAGRDLLWPKAVESP